MLKLSFNPFLSTLSEKELITLVKKECNYTNDAKTALLKKYQPYISNLLKLYPNYIKEDLEVLAYVGLIKAIENFDMNKNVKLITFARFYIKKEIAKFIKNELELTKREVSELLIEDSQYINFEEYELRKSRSDIYMEKLEIENSYDNNIIKTSVNSFTKELSPQQQLLINLIINHGCTSAEAARHLNISKPRVTQLLNSIRKKGLKKLSYLNN